MRIHQSMWKIVKVVMILMTLFGIIITSASLAEDKDSQGYDLIILVDNGFSWSSQYSSTDVAGYRFDAAAAALNLLGTENTRGNYVLFSSIIYNVTDKGKLIELDKNEMISLKDISFPSGKANRVQIMRELTDQKTLKGQRPTGGTDIGLALNAAVDALSYYDNGNKKIIILVTDGGYYFTNNEAKDAWTKNQKLNKSQEMASAAKAKAEGKGIVINTVLVKYNEFTDLMKNELPTSDGIYSFVNDASELPEAFTQIIGEITGVKLLATNSNVSSDGNILIPVPNSNIDEISIQIPTNNLVPNSLRLINPDGEELIESNDNYYIVQGELYSFIKVLSPQKGNWKISYQGKGINKEITTKYTYRYNLTPVTTLSVSDINKNESVTVNTVYRKNTTNLKDADLYQIPAKLIVKKQDHVVIETMMNHSENGYTYTIDSLKEYGAGDYIVTVYCEGDGIQLASNEATVTLSNKRPVKEENSESLTHQFDINIPGDEGSYAVQKWSWDLKGFYKDPDGDDLTYKLVSNNQDVDAKIEGTVLKIETKKNTAADEDVVITAVDSDGEEGERTVFHVDVKVVENDVGTIVYGPTHSITKKDDRAKIRVQYKENDTTITAGKYYEIPAYLTLRKGKTVLQSGIKMAYDGDAYAYTINDLKQYGAGEFSVEIRLQSGSFLKDCETIQFELVNASPTISTGYKASADIGFIIDNPLDKESYDKQTQVIDLSAYYSDPDEDDLTWFVKSNNADVDLKIDKPKLIITTKKNTATIGKAIIGVKDSDNAEGPDFEALIEVVSIEDSIQIESQLSADNIQKNETVVIKSWYIKNHKTLSKEDELNQIPMTVSLKKGNEILLSSQPMIFVDGVFSYTLSDLKKYGSGEYEVIISAESKLLKKDSLPQKLILHNSAPKLINGIKSTVNHRFDINIPGDYDSYKPQTWSVDLNSMVEDINNEQLTFSIDSISAEVKANIEKDQLSITTEQNTPTHGTIKITVEDEEGKVGPTIDFVIDVVSIEAVYDKYQALFVPVSDARKNFDTEILLYVADENSQPILNDSYLPSEIKTVISESGHKEEILMYRQDDGYYRGVIHTKQEETVYEAETKIAVGEKEIKSDTLIISTKDKAPIAIKSISEDIRQSALVGIDADQQIDLSMHFIDPDKDSLDFSVNELNAAGSAAITINGNIATIHPVKGIFCFPADYVFSFTATDKDGLSVVSDQASMRIWPVFMMAAVGAALLIILIAFFRFRHWKNAHFDQAAFEVSYGYKGLELPDGLSDPLPEGKHKAMPLRAYYTDNACFASEKRISQDSLQTIKVCPMSKGRVRIMVPEGIGARVYEGEEVEYNIMTQAYSGKKEIKKCLVLKNNQSFTVVNNECRVTFKLVGIRSRNS